MEALLLEVLPAVLARMVEGYYCYEPLRIETLAPFLPRDLALIVCGYNRRAPTVVESRSSSRYSDDAPLEANEIRKRWREVSQPIATRLIHITIYDKGRGRRALVKWTEGDP